MGTPSPWLGASPAFSPPPNVESPPTPPPPVLQEQQPQPYEGIQLS